MLYVITSSLSREIEAEEEEEAIRLFIESCYEGNRDLESELRGTLEATLKSSETESPIAEAIRSEIDETASCEIEARKEYYEELFEDSFGKGKEMTPEALGEMLPGSSDPATDWENHVWSDGYVSGLKAALSLMSK